MKFGDFESVAYLRVWKLGKRVASRGIFSLLAKMGGSLDMVFEKTRVA